MHKKPQASITSVLVTIVLLAIVVFLIVGKMTGYINISWWTVFSPFWVPAAILVIATFIGILLMLRDEKKFERMEYLQRKRYDKRD